MAAGATRCRLIALRVLTLLLSSGIVDDGGEECDHVPDSAQFGPYGAVDLQSEQNVQVVLLKIYLN